MKPIDITLSAFGPYAKETYINFEFLSTEGVFLITGDTGAGKTTIFDAISFALYGEGSGGRERRNARSFRSDYADAKTETFIRFRFSHRNRTYEITRNPEYERDKVVGKGKTKQGARAHLVIEETGEIVDGVSQVDAYVLDLISLTREQFSQTVMIAQGDFLKILNAKSDDRKKLFQKIFNTDTYSQIQMRLKDMYANSKSQVDKLTDRINGALLRIQVHAERAEEFAPYLSSPENAGKLLPLLDGYISESKKELAAFSKEIEALEEKSSALTQEMTREKQIHQSFDEMEALLKEALLHEKKKQDVFQMEKAVQRAHAAIRIQPQEATLENAERFLKDQEKRRLLAIENQDKYRPLLESIEKELSSAKAQYDENFVKIKTRAEALQKAVPVIEKYHQAQKKLVSVSKLLENALLSEKNAYGRYLSLRESFYLGQASLIAETLKDGAPCPVCGSTSHPAPAKKGEGTVTQNALEDAEKAYNLAARTARDREKDAAVVKTDLESAKNTLLSEKLSTDDTAESLSRQVFELNRQADLLEKSVKELTSRAENGKKYLAETVAVIRQTEEEIKKRTQDVKEGREALLQLLEAEKFSSYEDFVSAKLSRTELSQMEAEIKAYNDRRIQLESRIGALKEKLDGKTRPDSDKTLSLMNDTNASLREKRRVYAEIDKRTSANEDAYALLSSIRKQLEKEMERWALISDVYSSVSGQQSGKMKLSFETYVQQYYFKQVISAANKRLSALTEGLFTLRIKQEAVNLRSQAGLDLEVLDRSTGQWRDVSTLSGGESFMASLALALGLSDVVQAGSGGVRIDAMFIDEGFGSLDENALRQALALLTRLADGHRLIGVISHMPELKERITKRIIVSKKTFGSVASVEEG